MLTGFLVVNDILNSSTNILTTSGWSPQTARRNAFMPSFGTMGEGGSGGKECTYIEHTNQLQIIRSCVMSN